MIKQKIMIVISTLCLSAVVWAHSGATGIVKERMDLMDSLKTAMQTLKPYFQGKQVYDPQVVKNNAELIRDSAGEKMSRLFPENSLQKPSEALPEIWKDWSSFEKLSNDLQALSQALYDANGDVNKTKDVESIQASSEDMFKEIAKNCSDCHKQFRER